MAGAAKLLVFVILSLSSYIRWTYALSTSNKHQAFSMSGSASQRTLRRNSRSLASSMTSFNVTSFVMSRFARVTYRSRMENNLDEDTEVTFSVILPEAAFITQFDMVVDGITFVGTVKAKDVAERQYDEAIKSGNSAGLIKANVRESQTFDVSANVPAHSSVDFHLVYQELLHRRHGIYNHVIRIDTREVVDDLRVTVYITEKTGITKLEAIGPKLGAVPTGDGLINIRSVDHDIRRSRQQAKVTFKPSATEQRLLLNLPEKERKFIVKYDVTRESLGGEIQTRDGYFVHFFAPEGLPVLPKTVIFVIDISGSMLGRKIEQTKSAFASVLGELRSTDKFNIVTFSSRVSVWESGRIPSATKQNVLKATRYVERISASGGTNFNAGLLEGVELLRDASLEDSNSHMIVILTDGRPTAGMTDKAQIRLNIRTKVRRRLSVFCLGFGGDVDHDFLNKLASENNGLARKIYADSDAGLQLEGFFKEVATPLLLNVSLKYPGQAVHDVTTTDYDKYFSGSEVIVVGSYDGTDINLRSVVSGTSLTGDVNYNVTSREVDDTFQHGFSDTGEFGLFVERMWAHLTIKERLKQRDLVDSMVQIDEINNEVRRLALKYNLVTPLTSMVVTLPEDEVTPSEENPPCFRRGEITPGGEIGRHIWCPYVLGDRSDERTSERNNDALGVALDFHQSAGQIEVLQYRGDRGGDIRGIQRRVKNKSRTMFRSRGRSPKSKRVNSPPRRAYRRRRPSARQKITPPPRWKRCSGTLDSSTGTMRIPTRARSRAYICEWDITLPQGYWIDLYVQHINTSSNKVKITQGGKKILQHTGGASKPRYISITDNEIHVEMVVEPSDKRRPGIVISYEQFVPSEPDRIDTVNTGYPIDVFSATNLSCGETFASSGPDRGYVSSPGYPLSYPGNSLCLWTFVNEDPEDIELRISFNRTDIEASGDQCPHDKVILQDGANEHVVCGYEIPQSLASQEGVVRMAFVSDGFLEAPGFLAQYEFVSIV